VLLALGIDPDFHQDDSGWWIGSRTQILIFIRMTGGSATYSGHLDVGWNVGGWWIGSRAQILIFIRMTMFESDEW
jgi:hypothetical protein